MVKRTTAIFFILLANIILLAHAVVPHHHHKTQVCIVSCHCQTDCQDHHHDAPGHNHHDDGKSDGSDCCVLKQVVAIPSNLVKQDFRSLDSDNDLPDFDGFQCVLLESGLDTFVPIDSSATRLHFLSSDYFHFVTASIGLRAPPIV